MAIWSVKVYFFNTNTVIALITSFYKWHVNSNILVNDIRNKLYMNCGNENENEEMIVAVNAIYAIA